MSHSASYAISPWLTCYQPRPHAKIRLFCLPHGGGGPQSYREWAKGLPDDIEVFALSLPGRGSRRKEAPVTDMHELAEAIVEALQNYLDKPLAFFGHSVGALLCFEVARHMRDSGLSLPVRLLVSAHKAPHDSREGAAMYTLPDRELLRIIRELGLVPDDALQNEELIEFILPPMKADFELSETYSYDGELPLSCPITALGGREDSIVSEQELAAWKQYSSTDFSLQIYDGGHFYTESHQESLLRDISSVLREDLQELPRSIMKGETEPYPQKCLHELFRDQAAKHPEAIAVADIHQQMSFRELDECTDLLASYLQKQGTVVDSIVGIYMESSVEYVIAYLSILKAGGAYMPVEIAYPEALLDRVLEKAKPVMVLTNSQHYDTLPESWKIAQRALKLNEGWQDNLREQDLPELDKNRKLPTPDSLAYCVMTSGTTGTPKGILCPHRGAVNSYYWRYYHYPYEEGEREACNVFLVWEVIRAILQGRSSYVIPDDVIYDPRKLVDFLERYEITRILFTPSLLEQVLNTPQLDIENRLKQLKIVWLNGEVVPTALRNRFFQRLPEVKLLNDYSISECHDVCTHDLEDIDPVLSPKYAPLGLPMSNVSIYLLDENMQPVPRGMSAEIYVGGDSLARGYLDEPEKTAERFVLDPILNDGSRLFRTGDLGMILPNGHLEVKGRVEFMIKLRGYSIVLGAVETAIIEHPAVNTAVVITKDNPETKQPEALVAYIVSDGSMNSDELGKELRAYLKERLPHYAIPSVFIPIDELPLHDVTGKLDRKKLPAPESVITHQHSSAPKPIPTSVLEQRIIDIWESVLNIRAGEASDNFFDLGGHSLMAIRMCDALSEAVGVEVSVIDVYEHPTVQMLADFLRPKIKITHPPTPSLEKRGREEAEGFSADSPINSEGATITDPKEGKHASIDLSTPSLPKRGGRGGSSNDIAIIGMACRFPGANDPETFWQNLCDGVCSIRELSDEELQTKGVQPEVYEDEDYRKIGAILDDVDQFDYAFWGLSKKEVALMDPQQRIFLECCWQALEDAGYAPRTDGERTGVFGGCYSPTYLLHYLQGGGMLDPTDPAEFHLTETGNDKDYIATRVSYLLNLQGPSITVQTSCSTAASVVATACQSLLAKQCDTAVAGASSLTFPQAGYQYVEGHINSRDGKVRTFDAGASGTILGDGAGVVVMKRLEDALEAGDRVVAVIKGFAVNNDGNAKAGYSAPSVQGQKTMIADAQKMAEISPESISYIEAHGTGTLIGDPIEVRALTEVFRRATQEKGFCGLGSVKPNIGHSNIAAGMAGLMKAALSLQNRQLTPTINFTTPNPAMKLEETPFYVNTELRDWTPPDGQPRRAGVTCLGIGGTNCHFVLQEAPVQTRRHITERNYQLLTISAKTEESLEQNRSNLLRFLQTHPEVNLADLAHTLHVGREEFKHRLALSCHDHESALSGLEKATASQVSLAGKKTIFLFPGQGSQHIRMGYGVYEAEPTFRAYVDRCSELLETMIGVDLRTLVYASEGSPEAERAFQYAYYLQPAIFTLQYSLARTLMDWGISPDALAGHSIGEYTAACISGMLSLEDALSLIVARSKAMEEAEEGAMLSVNMSKEDAKAFLEGRSELALAVINSPRDMVLSGPCEAVEEAEQQLRRQDVACQRVHVNRAFHSPMMEAAAKSLTDTVRKVSLNSPQIPIVSNLSGSWLTEVDALDPEYWGRHMRQTVRFADNVQTLLDEKPGVMLEVGSHKILSKLLGKFTNEFPQAERPLVLSCLRHPRDTKTTDISAFTQAVGVYWAAGGSLDWEAFHRGEERQRIALPTYQFARQRCWKENPKTLGITAPTAQQASTAPVSAKITDIRERAYIPSWSRSFAPADEEPAVRQSYRWLIFMDKGPDMPESLGEILAGQLEGRSDRVLRVYRSFNPHAAQKAGSYFVNPAQADEYQALFEKLSAHNLYPQRILDLWSMTGEQNSGEKDVSMCYYHSLFLAKALAAQTVLDPVDIWILTDKTVQVSQEAVLPIKSTIFGPAIVLPQENPQITCRLVDLQYDACESPDDIAELANSVLEECTVAQPDSEPVVALRGQARWVQRYEAVPLAARSNGASRVRPGGVYLITGGLGRIAGKLSERFARIGAKLVLSDIVDFPARSRWEELVKDPQTPERLQQTLQRLLQLEQAGAEIMVMRTNMRNLEEVKQLLRATIERFGAIDGIIHAAGVANLRYLPDMTYEISEQEFAPKVHGLLNLDQAIGDMLKRSGQKPGFVFLFSSLASILGGFSMTAYTAANRFMDAFVQNNPRKHGVAWICANWDDWDFKYTKEQAGAYEHTTAQFAMSPEEGVETLERIVSLPAAVQVLVATRAMQPRVEQWLHQTRPSEQQPSASANTQPAFADAAVRPQAPRPAAPTASPSNGLEQQVLEVFREVLETPDMSREESFFEVGGDSLTASQILLKLRRTVKEHASQLSLSALFDHPTVRELTPFLDGGETSESVEPPVSKAPQTAGPVSAGPPSNELEQRILKIFRDVLETPDMSAEESFFDVGGDSLMASQILLKLRRSLKEHAQRLSLASLFENSSVRALTDCLTQNAS